MNDASLRDLYDKRRGIAKIRHRAFEIAYQELHDRVVKTEQGHPYRTQSSFSSCEWYSNAGRGKTLNMPSEGHLYRICTLGSLLAKDNQKDGVNFTVDTPAPMAYREFLRISAPYRDYKDGWMPAESMLFGSLPAWRSISWWTSTELTAENANLKALELGLFRVDECSVILRLNLKALTENTSSSSDQETMLKIPTELDAFAYPIFYATDFTAMPQHGESVDLSRLPKVMKGHPEYILQNVNLKFVDMMPVPFEALPLPIDKETYRDIWEMEPWVCDALNAFYDSILSSESNEIAKN